MGNMKVIAPTTGELQTLEDQLNKWGEQLCTSQKRSVSSLLAHASMVNDFYQDCKIRSAWGDTTFAAKIKEWLGYGYGTALQWKTIGSAVGKLEVLSEKLPLSVRSLFELSNLPEESIIKCLEAKGKDTTVEDIYTFKKALKEPATLTATVSPPPAGDHPALLSFEEAQKEREKACAELKVKEISEGKSLPNGAPGPIANSEWFDGAIRPCCPGVEFQSHMWDKVAREWKPIEQEAKAPEVMTAREYVMAYVQTCSEDAVQELFELISAKEH
jgi:hypothetical protein